MDEQSIHYVDAEARLGRTVVVVAEGATVVGLISIADALRPGVKSSISDMKQSGIEKVVMLSGDNFLVASEVASQVGVDEVYANLLPQDKLKHVEEYKRQGKRVVFVGDGINDAPALASANVGVAMGITGTDVAMETAGIVLMTDDLSKIARTIRLSKKVMSVVKQNVVFALCINVAGLLISTARARARPSIRYPRKQRLNCGLQLVAAAGSKALLIP